MKRTKSGELLLISLPAPPEVNTYTVVEVLGRSRSPYPLPHYDVPGI